MEKSQMCDFHDFDEISMILPWFYEMIEMWWDDFVIDFDDLASDFRSVSLFEREIAEEKVNREKVIQKWYKSDTLYHFCITFSLFTFYL